MSITAVRLLNFRGFRDARIELKPLTVLLGPNSAGKSSFGHALAAMTHAHRFYASTPQASLSPLPNYPDEWPVDLGKTSDLRTVGAEGPVRIELETRGGLLELGFGGLDQYTPDLLISYIAHPSGEQSAAVASAVHTAVETAPSAQSGFVPIEGTIDQVDTRIKLTRINEQQWREGTTEVSVILDGLIVKAVQHMTGTPRVLSGAASDDLRSLLETLTYLRATRKRPSRRYEDNVSKQQPIGYSGECTPSILLRRGHEQVTYREPPQKIPRDADEAQKINFEVWKEKQETLFNAVGTWLSWLGLATVIETVPPSPLDTGVSVRVTLEHQAPHDITEIGFGVSQVMPVLVAGLLQPKNSLFIVDLPEAHLHPRPQGAIADFFCALALSGRSALVETHSEMFFHRLRLCAAMNPWLMKNIAVYFIDSPKDGVCRPPREVGLGFNDELRWPEGFLQEAWETETQINAVRQARERSS